MLPNKNNTPTSAINSNGHISALGERSVNALIDPEICEQQCALLERNEQAARRRVHENEYWRQRTLARQLKSQSIAQTDPDLKALTAEHDPLEAMDAKHQIGEILNVFMDEYNKLKPSRLFFDWVSSMTPVTQARLIQKFMQGRGYSGTVNTSWVRTFNRGIRYMNASERRSYQIQINNGLLYQNGTEFDTGKMKTQFSGSGVAIFFQNMDGTFYSSSHLEGRLPHSSSPSSTHYRSAGEWKVTKGRIKWISGRSGFYKPTMEQLVNAISDLKFQNALEQTTARVFDSKDGTQTDVDASFLASDFHYFEVCENG